ncbi:JAB domain-containing protein [Psychrobacillus sp. FSL K6-4615]|uniref:JAB domain-containing protein n=1 Tax=Psychrobacillus sp. FSL K6-4615 TaxID=2921551 RepID=UPI0030F4C9DB
MGQLNLFADVVAETSAVLHTKQILNLVSLKMVKESSVLYDTQSIGSPKDAYAVVRKILEDADREMFLVMALDVKNRPINIQICHIGSLNASIVHPREVFKMAILSNAASIMVFHNHPSGLTNPSSEDIEVTRRLEEAGRIIGVELLDHLIIGENDYLSLKDKGYV